MSNAGGLNDVLRDAAQRFIDTMIGDTFARKTPTTVAGVAMASADTEYSLALPAGATEIGVRLRDTTVTWRWSFTAGQVAGGAGFAMKAGDSLSIQGPIAGATIYFAADSASMTMDVFYLV